MSILTIFKSKITIKIKRKMNLENSKSIKNDILDSETKLILVLENINTENSTNVLTAKSESILTILH